MMKKQTNVKEQSHETNMILSKNLKISWNTRHTHLGSMNTLVIGGTGEGKSRGFVKPNLYSLPVDPKTGKAHSFVITDPKGELCRDTAGFLAANGYEIKILNVLDQYYSDCYNPFRYIRSPESLLIMVDSIVDNANGGLQPKDPHWSNSAKNLLNSICYAVYYEFSFRDQNFSTVSKLLNKCGSAENNDAYKSDYDLFIDELEENSEYGCEHPAVVWRKKVSAKGSEMSSIISTAQTAVRLFASKNIQRITDVDTIAMDEVGDRPTALYMIIPTTNRTYDFLISLMYTQLFESLYYRAQNVYNGSLPHHVTFFQDEFATTGKVPDFDKKIATFRSTNISSCIIIQSPAQLENVYDKASISIIDNIHIYVFLGSGGIGEKSASKWMQDALGQKTVLVEQSSTHDSKTSGMFVSNSKNIEHSYSPTERPLLYADEIFRLSPDRCIIMIKSHKPILDYKVDLDTCMNYSLDMYTEKTNDGRILKSEYIWPTNDKNPDNPARRRTPDSYKKGLDNASVIDLIQHKQREEERIEDEKYRFYEEDEKNFY